MTLIPDGTFDALHNASITVERSQGNRTAKGFEKTSTTTVLSCRCDAQDGGRKLERAQQQYEAADLVAYCSDAVTDVEPGDDVTVNYDDGRKLEGSVEETRNLDSSVLVAL